MKRTNYLWAFALLALASGCYYDNAQEMYPAGALNLNCDTSGTITYTNHVKPIYDANCNTSSCHGPLENGDVVLDNYDDALLVDTATLMGCINLVPGFFFMPPPDGKLSDCNIAIIQKWVNNGQPE